ncbi:MAG: protein translocase subunit SecD [Patescibacteria group bacterium]
MFKRIFWPVFILAVGTGLAYFAYSDYRPLKLGLDLRGGSHLVYEADVSLLASPADIDPAMQSLRTVIERRINALGVAEPVIQVETVGLNADAKHRLIVELPGVTDLGQARETIQATPVLEFRAERPEGAEKEAIIAEIKKVQDALAKGEAPDDIDPELISQDPYFVPTELTGRFLNSARVEFGQQALSPSISLEFNTDGAALFAQLTKENLGKRIGIYLDGVNISAPVVQSEITDGRAEITGQFTLEEAKALARDLNLGALPVPVTLVSTQTIGATLGEEALNRGVRAGVIGFVAVIIFMILWYRLPGIVAGVALAFYVALVLSIFKLIGVTLTAAGIAGLILSLGIALDANVLIFERLKEERRRGRVVRDAAIEGFTRAWTAIRDSNLSGIISSLILYWFGTSLIKGFAVTLSVGIVISLFTATTITRTLLLSLYK